MRVPSMRMTCCFLRSSDFPSNKRPARIARRSFVRACGGGSGGGGGVSGSCATEEQQHRKRIITALAGTDARRGQQAREIMNAPKVGFPEKEGKSLSAQQVRPRPM